MTISANFPNVKPSLLLDFANAKQLPPTVTFTRATTATYYDGSTTAVAEQNLLIRSQTFNSDWTQDGATLTGSQTAPDGTSTAWLLTDTGTSADHRIYIFPDQTLATYQIGSVYLKNGTRRYGMLRLQSGGNTAGAVFDLQTGTVASTGGTVYYSSSITSVGGGWYRCVVVGTSINNSPNFVVAMSNTATYADNIFYTGTGATLSAWGAQCEGRSTPNVTSYTVTTTAAITNYSPVLLTAGGGQPRFEHNPTTSESLGLEIEMQRTNSFTYSTTFDSSAWLPNNATLLAGIPELNIYTIIPTASNTTHQFYDQVGKVVTAQAYTISLNGKAYGYTKFKIADVSTGNGCWFDVSAGTVGTANSGYVGSIVAIGNGFYRCSITFTPSAGTVYYGIYIGNTTETGTYLGNGFSGLYISSPQFEAGAFPTSYIPTVTAAATRAADVVSMSGANFSSWYSPGNGTFYAEASTASTASDAMIAEATNSAGAFLDFSLTFATTSAQFINRFVASNNDMRRGGVVAANTMVKFSGSITNSPATTLASANGVAMTATTSQTLQTGADRMFIGSRGGSSLFLNAPIRKLAFYPAQLTQTQQNSITG